MFFSLLHVFVKISSVKKGSEEALRWNLKLIQTLNPRPDRPWKASSRGFLAANKVFS